MAHQRAGHITRARLFDDAFISDDPARDGRGSFDLRQGIAGATSLENFGGEPERE